MKVSSGNILSSLSKLATIDQNTSLRCNLRSHVRAFFPKMLYLKFPSVSCIASKGDNTSKRLPPIFRALQASSATRAGVRKANCEKVRLMYLFSFGTLTRISDEIEQPENMFSPCVAQRLRHLSQLDHWCGTFVVASIPPTAGCGR